MRETLRFQGQILRATVSRDADRWYVSIAVRFEHCVPVRPEEAIAGCDLGLSTFAKIYEIGFPQPSKSESQACTAACADRRTELSESKI